MFAPSVANETRSGVLFHPGLSLFASRFMRAGFDPSRCTKPAPASATKIRARLPILLAVLTIAAAEAATPQPPRRPDQIDQPAAAPSESPQASPTQKPQASPSKAPQTAPPGRAPVDVDVDKLQPSNLPPASRERMHQCGEEWRKLKMEGRSAGLIWRSFAEKCLTR
jgi:hypothetical protein